MSVEGNNLTWKVVLQMQKDQREFFKFQKDKYEWELKVNQIVYKEEPTPMFPNHILGTLEEEEDLNKEEEGKIDHKKINKKFVKAGLVNILVRLLQAWPRTSLQRRRRRRRRRRRKK